MPREMFGSAAVTSASRATVRRGITITSIILHAAGLAAIADTQLLSPGPLPTPRVLLAFDDMPVKVAAEVPPPPPRREGPLSTTTKSKNLAPVVPPTTITPESRQENIGPSAPGVVLGETHGIDSLVSMDVIDRVAPPPAPPPTESVRLHPGMQAPRRTVNVDPKYPSLAQSARVQGVVILEAVIDANGTVTSVHVLRSIPLLDQAAIDAVSQWRYTPAMLNGAAVPVIVTVTVNFTLGR